MTTWISMSAAAKQFGYPSAIALRRRIHELREQGKVEDIGHTPQRYLANHGHGAIKVYWQNARTMQIDKDAPAGVLAARKLKAKKKKSR